MKNNFVIVGQVETEISYVKQTSLSTGASLFYFGANDLEF